MSSRASAIANIAALPLALACIVAIASFLGSYAQYVLALVIVHCLIGAALVMIVGYTRVIMLANDDVKEDFVEAVRQGCCGILPKCLWQDELRHAYSAYRVP